MRNGKFLLKIIVFVSLPTLLNQQLAFGIETLPDIIIFAPEKSLQEQINTSELLTEEDITIGHERSISDVLTGLPSISQSRIGGFGQPGPLYVRGVGGQGLITLDGIPLIQAVPGFLNLDTLPSEAIKSAEIDRGPGAAYLPFQALGGAIRLATQDKQDTGSKLFLEGGTFGILRETIQGSVAGHNSRMTVTLNRADAFDGAHAANAKTNPEREPSHFTQGIMRFSTDLNSRLNWQSSMLYRKSGADTDKFGLDHFGHVALQDDTNSHAKEETWLAQSSLKLKATTHWDSQLQLGYTQAATVVNLGTNINGIFTRLYLANWHNEHTIIDDKAHKNQWRIIWGGQGRYEQGTSPTTGEAHHRTLTSGFIDTQAQYGDLSAEAGVRIESYNNYGEHTLFKAASTWQITPTLTLRASGGTGYRIPSYTELLFLFFGNPALNPECSASSDVGFEWYPLSGMKLNLTGYYQRYYDLIAQSFEPDKGPISQNIPAASVAGVELNSQYTWSDKLETGLSYTYSDNQNLTTNKLLPWHPSHIARLWGQHTLSQWPVSLWVEAVVRSGSWNDFANTLPVNSAVQINAAIRYGISDKTEIYLRGENLTNNRSPQAYSTDMAGIVVYGGLKLAF